MKEAGQKELSYENHHYTDLLYNEVVRALNKKGFTHANAPFKSFIDAKGNSEKEEAFKKIVLYVGLSEEYSTERIMQCRAKILPERFIGDMGLKLNNYFENVKQYQSKLPFFFDKSQIFWFWNAEESRWQIIDEVDIMNSLDNSLGFYGQTIPKGVKGNYLEAFKRVGRLKMPQDAPKRWIQFRDHAISLRSGNVYKVTHDYFFCNPIPWKIGSSTDTPTIDKLFSEWVGNHHVPTLHEMIAYCCYPDYPIQTLFCLFGGGRNGKSSFLRLLAKFFGNANICSTDLDVLIDSRFESCKLYKKLVCFMGETNFGVLKKSGLLKRLTGQDMIGFEMKGKMPFDEMNYAKIIIASNSLPSSYDTSEGWFRRWIIIDFPNEFAEGKDIVGSIPDIEFENLAYKVSKLLPAILERGNFTNQGSIEDRKTRYVLASNPLPVFINECCRRYDEGYVSYRKLYTAYVRFLQKRKRRKVSMKEFGSALEDEGFFVDKGAKKDKNGDFQSGYWVDGLVLDNLDNLDSFSTQFTYTGKPSEKPVQIVQTVQKSTTNPKPETPQEETILTWNSDAIVYHACQKEACGATECNFDSKGVPYCRKHFDEMGI